MKVSNQELEAFTVKWMEKLHRTLALDENERYDALYWLVSFTSVAEAVLNREKQGICYNPGWDHGHSGQVTKAD